MGDREAPLNAPVRSPLGDQRWSTLLRNHARATVACDFFVAVTATFRRLYVFVVIEHGSRRLVRVAVTPHPSAAWTLQQLREVVGFDRAHQYLIHDRHSIFARSLDDSTRVPGLVDTAVRVAAAINPEGMGGSLQPRTSAHGARVGVIE